MLPCTRDTLCQGQDPIRYFSFKGPHSWQNHGRTTNTYYPLNYKRMPGKTIELSSYFRSSVLKDFQLVKYYMKIYVGYAQRKRLGSLYLNLWDSLSADPA